MVHRIRARIQGAHVTILTRSDLAPGFKMLEGVETLVDPQWKRGVPFELDATLQALGVRRDAFDCILEHPDPTQWVSWQLGTLTPKLVWDPAWDGLCQRFALPDAPYIGVHVQTETQYGYEKNWPQDYWRTFFQRAVKEKERRILLFGVSQAVSFEGEGIVDLRGKTTLFEMLSLIKNHCRTLVVPDSGVLSMTYYIDTAFPLDIISLWADPRQGVLKQNVASPNPRLRHTPLIAAERNLRNVSIDAVLEVL